MVVGPDEVLDGVPDDAAPDCANTDGTSRGTASDNNRITASEERRPVLQLGVGMDSLLGFEMDYMYFSACLSARFFRNGALVRGVFGA
jgi:hypothetical protein